jgi:hypothetical protein
MVKAILLSAIVLSLNITTSCGSYRIIEAWVLPSGFHGWVLMERGNPRCPPAEVSLTSVTFKVSSSTQGCSATPIFKQIQFQRFFELDPSGHRHELRIGSEGKGKGGQIWEFRNGVYGEMNNPCKFYYTRFFVGSEAEYNRSRETTFKWRREHGPTHLPCGTNGHQKPVSP